MLFALFPTKIVMARDLPSLLHQLRGTWLKPSEAFDEEGSSIGARVRTTFRKNLYPPLEGGSKFGFALQREDKFRGGVMPRRA
jgi:hypothetical protein